MKNISKTITIYVITAFVLLLTAAFFSSLSNESKKVDAARMVAAIEEPGLSDAAGLIEGGQKNVQIAPAFEDVSGKRVELPDIPEGKLRTVLMAMPSDLRNEVLAKISELDIPDNDFDSLRLHPNHLHAKRYQLEQLLNSVVLLNTHPKQNKSLLLRSLS